MWQERGGGGREGGSSADRRMKKRRGIIHTSMLRLCINTVPLQGGFDSFKILCLKCYGNVNVNI